MALSNQNNFSDAVKFNAERSSKAQPGRIKPQHTSSAKKVGRPRIFNEPRKTTTVTLTNEQHSKLKTAALCSTKGNINQYLCDLIESDYAQNKDRYDAIKNALNI